MTIANDLTSINTIKQNIKTAIVSKGVDMTSTPFDQYPTKIANISSVPVAPNWVRPADWLTLPTISPTDEKFAGLFAVSNDDANLVALLAAGAYTVDWGDGTVENFAANTKASHQYTYANISDTTLCSRGYKQVIVTVTPQSGQHLTTVDLQQRHPSVPSSTPIQGPWLDTIVGSSYLAQMWIGSSSPAVRCDLVECISIAYSANTVTGFNAQNCIGLQVVNLPNVLTSYVTTLSMFSGCSSLTKINNLNMLKPAAGSTVQSMFNNCRALTSVLAFDTSSVVAFSSMFAGCRSLTSIPLFNTSAGTNFMGMFNGCSVLTSVPALDTTNGTDFSSMFSNCISLTSIPLFNTSAGTNFASMLTGCVSLTSVPAFDTSNAITVASMFSGCSLLKNIPTINTAKANSMYGLFNGCSSLETVSITTTNMCSNFGLTFSQCYSLRQIPAISFAADTSNALTNTFNGCWNLSSIKATGIGLSFSVSNCKLSAAALNEIYTNLPTVTGKTITVTGNWGAATSTTSIATAKGWTVSK